MTDRAVSHAVGFVLIFGIVISGATLAVVVGQDAITDVSGFEQNRNAERAMTLLGQDIDHLAFSRSASAESALNIDDGQIRHDDASSITVSVEDSSGDSLYADTIPTGSIVFEKEDISLRYENGIVIRSVDGTSVPVTEAELSCRGNQAIVSIVSLNGNADRQLGSGRITVDTFRNETTVLYPTNRTGEGAADDATSVTVEANSPTSDVWVDVLDEAPNWQPAGSDRFQCDVGSDGRVYVRQTIIDVEFQR